MMPRWSAGHVLILIVEQIGPSSWLDWAYHITTALIGELLITTGNLEFVLPGRDRNESRRYPNDGTWNQDDIQLIP